MPELPEVETTMSALQPFVEKKIVSVDINNRNLRWKIEKDFEKNISNKKADIKLKKGNINKNNLKLS